METLTIINPREELLIENERNESLPDESKIPSNSTSVPEEKDFGSITMPGEMFFSDANETLSLSEEVVESLKSDPTTEIDELDIFEISNDSNEKKLTTQINPLNNMQS